MHVMKLIEEDPCIVVKLIDDKGVDIATQLQAAPIHQINGHATWVSWAYKLMFSNIYCFEFVLWTAVILSVRLQLISK